MQVRIHHGPVCQPLNLIHLCWGKYSQRPEIYGRLQSGLIYTALLLIPLCLCHKFCIEKSRSFWYFFAQRVIMKEPCKPAQIEVCHRFQALGCIIPQRRWMKTKGWPMVDSNLHRFSWLWWTLVLNDHSYHIRSLRTHVVDKPIPWALLGVK